MTELSLYRKYRPASFDDLIGQDEIVQSLKNITQSGKVAHAYLFSGSRGVGKTSTARIFAKALQTDEKDIYELDAASNRKIENFRELSESVYSLPFASKYKVYIIDEVHMLTKEAFNAFLKTLEEPPAHVIFILATTDTQKVPDTVRSRCLEFNFKKASFKSIKETVKNIAEEEGFNIGDDAISLISFLAEGSFRDALGILQKTLSYTEGKDITLQDVETANAAPAFSLALNFLESLAQSKAQSALDLLQKAQNAGIDFFVLQNVTLELLRHVLLLRLNPSHKSNLDDKFTEETTDKLVEISKNAMHLNSKAAVLLIEKMELSSYMGNSPLPLEIFTDEVLK